MSDSGAPQGLRSIRLEDAYEQLRARALTPSCDEGRPLGYGLIMHRGLFTWMRTARAPTVPPTVRWTARRLPAQSELVNTIVSLIVGRPPQFTM